MKRLMDVLYYILGILFNVCFTVVLITAVLVVAISAFSYGTRLFVEDLSARENREIVLEIPDGSDTMAVAELLQEHGLIDEGAHNRWIFVIQARLNGSHKFFRSDTFTLNTGMGSAEIMQLLQSVPEPIRGDEVRITIPEGMTIRQIATYVQQEGLFTSNEFMNAVEADYPHIFLRDVPQRPNRLQGYLFPDTYILPENPRPEDLIIRMLNRFEEVFFAIFALSVDSDFTVDDIVIIASIIEKEIRIINDEHELASAVIRNRLSRGMRLEMPSTVLYVHNKPRSQLVSADLGIQSPYNTFIQSGLPRGPISSPGLRSLEAAMRPAAENFIYMVMKDDGTGIHVFTADQNEYNRARTEHNQIW
jgi:UPF0755 protein